MARQSRTVKQRLLRILPLLAVLALLLTALLLIMDVRGGSSQFVRHYTLVLSIAVFALVVLAISISYRLLTLYRNVKREAPGARLSARLVRNFLILAVPPALALFLFSINFLDDIIDGWFDVQVEEALQDALTIGQQFIDNRSLEARADLRRIAAELSTDTITSSRLYNYLRNNGPTELVVLSSGGQALAYASLNPQQSGFSPPPDFAFLQLIERGEYTAAEPTDQGLRVRILRPLGQASSNINQRYIQAFFPLPSNFSKLANNVEQAFHRYQNLNFLRGSLKQSYKLILSLVLLLTILFTVLAALAGARRLVKPISELASATKQVAAGDLRRQLSVDSQDELGQLVHSFNDMTSALQQAQQQAEHSRAELQAQSDYLETVLSRLSAGVLTLDAEHRLITSNPSSAQILGLPLEPFHGREIFALSAEHAWCQPLVDLVTNPNTLQRNQWQREIAISRSNRPLVLLCRGSKLPAVQPDQAGHVVVFDDVTILNQAQREAAWAEAARRLAHEVKNPLTPIQLAAERVQHKLQHKLDSAEAELLNRATQTIVSQVDALKDLVNAFGDYAREPALQRQALSLHEQIHEVAELYRNNPADAQLRLELTADPAQIYADAGRVRQLLHNLIRNATESTAERSEADILIRTETQHAGVQLRIVDNGSGFPNNILHNPFQPYRSTKPAGSGLGLAISQKIVAEHDGKITLSNCAGGACVEVWLPAPEPSGSDVLQQ